MTAKYKDVGVLIKALRKSAHLTQEKLGELAGISTAYVAAIEAGKNRPEPDVCRRLAAGLGEPPVKILRGYGWADNRFDIQREEFILATDHGDLVAASRDKESLSLHEKYNHLCKIVGHPILPAHIGFDDLSENDQKLILEFAEDELRAHRRISEIADAGVKRKRSVASADSNKDGPEAA